MGDPTDGWGELLDSLPAISSFVAPGQEDFFFYSQIREAGPGGQSSPLPPHDHPPTHSNHGSPYQYYPPQAHQLTDRQLAELKALDLASTGNSPGPPGPQAHDSPTRPSHQYTTDPNYNPHSGYAHYAQVQGPPFPLPAGAPAAPPRYGAVGPTDHREHPNLLPAQAHQPPVQEQVQQPYPAYMQYSTRPSAPYPSQAPQGAYPDTAGALAPSASTSRSQYASPPAPSALPPPALPPPPAAGPSVASPAGGVGPLTPGSPHAAQAGWGAPSAPPPAGTVAGGMPYSLSPMAAGGGPVRHVVDDFRTSPLPGSLGEQTPDRIGPGGPGSAIRFGYEAAGGAGMLEGRGTGGSGGAGGALASGSPSMQRYQAHVTSLERQIAELQKRCADLNGALEATQAARQEVEAKRDEAVEELQQANSRVKQRESSLEAARAAHNAMSTELRQAQEELHSSKDALAAAKDEVAQWQDRAAELGKELEAAKKKIELLGDSERRLSAENMALRKEAQQLNESLIKSRIESSELRERLREAQQDAARQAHNVQSLASRAEAEHEGAAAQMAAMRARVQELEAHNSQLTYDLAAYRDEAARARAAADAAKAAWSTKPAGIASDLPAASRQQGTISHSWLAGPADGPAVMPTRAAAAASGPPPPPDSAAAHRGAPPYTTSAPPPPQSGAELSSDAAAVAGVLRNLRPGVSFSRMDPETFRIMVRAEAEAMARARGGSDGGGGGGAGGGVGANSRPADPSYQPRYDKPQYDPAPADRRSYDFESSRYAAADRFDGGMYGASGRGMGGGYGKYNDTAGGGHDVGMGARAEERPSARQAWGGPSAPYPSSVEAGAPQVGVYGNDMRASMAAAGPVKSSAARALWAGPGQEAYDGSTNDARSAAPASPPPPYAIHTSDSSYAFRQPANVVGAGVGGRPGGASGALGGGGGDKASGQSPFGTEDTAKALLARSKALEDQLMALCAEKTNLEAEFARMPLGAGRNLRERNRKAVVEQRLELLNKDISGVRMQLKRAGIK